MRTLVLAAIAAVFLCGAAAPPTTMFGLGGSTCKDFASANPAAATEYRDWLLGYVSALASAFYPQDILRRTNPNAALAWIKDYCGKHPADGLGYAGTTFMDDLLNRVQKSH